MKLTYQLSLLALPVLAGCSTPELPECVQGAGMVGDTASVAYIATPDRLFLVWCDISFDEQPITTGGGQGPGYRREYIFGGGRSVQLKVWTEDGRNLRVAVNGTEYRVADGTTFLVRTHGGAARVTQLKQHLPGLPPTNETRERLMSREMWERLAEENSEVKAFLSRVEGKE